MKGFRTIWPVCLLLVAVLMGCAPTGKTVPGKPKVTPKSRAEAKEKLGLSMIEEGNLQMGLKELLEARDLDPGNPDIHLGIGIAYRKLGEYAKAVTYFQRALALKPDFPDANNNLGMVYALMGRWEKAIDLFEKAISNYKYERRHTAFENLGTVYFYRGDYRQAVVNYQKALRLEPDYSPAYEKMGLAYERLKEWDHALFAYQQAVRLEPRNPLPHLYLGRLCFQLKRYEDAETALRSAIRNDVTGIVAQEARRLLREIKKAREGKGS
ncbi:MAG: tetratricopeptide repeat protein [Deltaproteobacteria bacterium]|nr:tetratricopeptide repeat protein [Deltaproteobacteria bacterium]